MSESVKIGQFVLETASDDDFFYGTLKIENSLDISPFIKVNTVEVIGKAYDFDDGKSKSYIKLKFYSTGIMRYYGDDNTDYDIDVVRTSVYHPQRLAESDIHDHTIEGFPDYDIGKGIIYLENTKSSSRAPDFTGSCEIRHQRQLESQNYNINLGYNFNLVGWYNHKIKKDSTIKVLMEFSEEHNNQIWLKDIRANTVSIIDLFSSNVNLKELGYKFNNEFIHFIYREKRLFDRILNENLIKQGYSLAQDYINEINYSSSGDHIINESIDLEKSKKKQLHPLIDLEQQEGISIGEKDWFDIKYEKSSTEIKEIDFSEKSKD